MVMSDYRQGDNITKDCIKTIMRRLIGSLFLLTFVFIQLGFSLSDPIKEIRQRYSAVHNSINEYKKLKNNDINVYKDLNPIRYSFESTTVFRLGMIDLERFYDKDNLRKTVVKFEGDRGDLVSEYYYWQDSVFFVFKRRIDYGKPKWSSNIDLNKIEIKEDRYYFHNDSLIRWVDHEGNIVDLKEIDSNIGKQILSDANLYLELKKE